MIGSERLQVEYPVITALGARLVFPSLQVMTSIQNEPHTRYLTTGTASNESVLVPGREMIARDTTNPLGNVPVQVNSLRAEVMSRVLLVRSTSSCSRRRCKLHPMIHATRHGACQRASRGAEAGGLAVIDTVLVQHSESFRHLAGLSIAQ